MDESKLVSHKEAISAETLNELEAKKYQDTCAQFGFIRRVRGDGNCFYRAFCFALVETLLHSKSTIQRFRHVFLRTQRVLMTAGFDECVYENLLNTFNSVLEQLETDGREETVLSLFNDQATSDGMVQYLRLVASAHLQSRADYFQHFVEAPSLKIYCIQTVEVMAMECNHVEILALAEELDVSLCIIAIECSDGPLTQHTIPEGSQPSLYFLYNNFHYDILYKHSEQEAVSG